MDYLKVGGLLIIDIDKVHAYLYKHFVLTFQYHRHECGLSSALFKRQIC